MRFRSRIVGPCGLAAIITLGVSPALASAGVVITRYAGISGEEGAPKPGPAVESAFTYPEAVAVDSRGNIYVADTGNNVIEKITQQGILSVIAGTGTAGPPAEHAFSPYSGVEATSSPLNGPAGVAVDSSGDVYVADSGNHVVEKVTPGGTLTVIAGNGVEGSPGSEAFPPHAGVPATSSVLNEPEGLAVDSAGDVYVADPLDQVVEKITPSGTLTVIAGDGELGALAEEAFSPHPGVGATTSDLHFPEGVAVDPSGNVYIGDLRNNVVERVTPSGILSVIAGTGTEGAPPSEAFAPGPGVPAITSALKHPEGLAFDASGDLYVADSQNGLVERITPGGTLSVVAGKGVDAPPTYGGSPAESDLLYPNEVTVDSSGVLYIDDESNSTIDRVGPEAPAPPTVTSATPGNGSATIDFLPPVSYGTSPITGYEASTDGGATWHTISTTPGAGETFQSTLTGLTDGATYDVLVRAVNGSGAGPASTSASVTPAAPASTSTSTSTATAKKSAMCLSRREINLHWVIPHGVKPGRIVVTVNGRIYRTLPPSARKVTVSFAGRSGPAPVTVRVRTRSGAGLTLHTVRALHICAPARSPQTLPNLHLLP
jgi:sugar lactone lactonase YvrE